MKGLLGGKGGGSGDKPPEGAGQDETEQLDSDQGSILLNMISQLRPGMDLSRITFPTFVLEPRSMLERITDFLSHPDLIFGAGRIEDPNERFISVLRYYLAGWHIKPKGVKKPYNPILGEIFRCRYKYDDGSQGFYIAEQVSHHPPVSAFYYCSPENKLEIFGELKPKSKFLGNSAANEMGGCNHAVLLDRPEDGEYDITMPNMYARGILFGKMVLELGDIAKVANNSNNISCDVEFKTKGFFSGTYNSIHGKVRSSKGELGEVTGKWSDQMYYQKGRSGEKELMFDASHAAAVPKVVAPESEQLEHESRRLWSKVTTAIKHNDQDAATDEKTAIEEKQRDLARQRDEKGEKWAPKYFAMKKDEYRTTFVLPKGDAKEQIQALETFIFGKSSQTTEGAADEASDAQNSKDGEPESASGAATSVQDAQSSKAGPTAADTTTTSPPEAAGSGGSSGPSKTVAAAPASTAAPVQSNTKSAPTSASVSPTNSTAAPPAKKEHSKPIAMAAAAIGLGGSTAASGSGGSSPDSGGMHGLLKRAHRKTHSSSVSSGTVPDREASSRHLPTS